MSSAAPSEVVLRTVDLSKRYGRLLALDGLSLEIRRGRVYGFLGPNVSALLAAGRLDSTDEFISLAPRPAPAPSELPDPAVAALVLAVYCAIFLAIAYTVFQRRDLSS